ncbi:hypothetical protein FQA47_012417 [Oryzias melastigma]|uniref:Uncharacterized protein n=1 Tax=Oryzias melastigma TaxID=30732 RepID=A0A834FQ15_ORYME|nr:hypothetical protein FQA47_012417 [Oryzias melastigma]
MEGSGCVSRQRQGKKRTGRKSPLILRNSDFTQSHSSATHPSVSIPYFLTFHTHINTPLPLPSSLYLSDPHHSQPLSPLFTYTQTSEPASRTLRLQLAKIQRLPPFPESFQFGAEPRGHSGTAQCLHTLPY